MYVHRSNRMEVLVDELAEVLRRPGLPVLSPETILIQSQGMERWLSRELAARLGGFCNARFPFPRAFIREAIDAVLGPAPLAALFEREVMTWAIAAQLLEHAEEKAFSPVTSYLKDDPGGVMRLQLSERIAHLFDQYLIYRPKLVLGWESGRGTDFQALLWRSLIDRYDRLDGLASAQPGDSGKCRAHFAARAAEFERRFSPLFVERGALPARLCIVGGASLPPLFLRLLGKLGECIEVHIFCLAPSREYLGHAAADADLLAWSTEDADVHPLLASLGQVGAAFQHILESEVRYVDGAGEFVDPPADSVLHALQSDLLNNRQRSDDGEPRLARPAPAQDDSISLVSCHSPMREVEVLRDRLLGLFDADATLRPDDIVVMAARIDAYVPLIEAVFSGDPRDPHHIPFRIADRSERSENVAAEGLLSLLGVLAGRLKASEVLDLLQCEPVRARFGIEALDLPTIYRWVHESGIRWGEDAAHRRHYGLPDEAANTWRSGLERLLLGYALSDDQRTCFAGAVPYDLGVADDVELLGRFVEFCETLFQARRLTIGEQTVARWCEILREIVEAFFADEGGKAWQLKPVYGALHAIEEAARLAEHDEPLALEVLAAQLLARFEEDKSSTEFASGGVTFCAMLPMRSIPFRVVCLLNMNDGEFPRIEQQLGFDKMSERPEIGDRSQRAEDRYLFLETLLSARERLIISHVGRGIQDNQVRPPAVVVAELSAAVEALLARPEPGEQEFLAPVEHPLQPFSPRAFDGRDGRLASYSETYGAGARALCGQQHAMAPLFSEQGLVRPPADETAQDGIELEELVDFFKNPARALLRRLGLNLEEDVRLVVDRETIESDALVRYAIGTRLLAAPESELGERQRVELGRGMLPFGAPGRLTLRALSEAASRIRRAKQALTAQGAHPALPITVRCEVAAGPGAARQVELAGVLEGLYWTSVEGEPSARGVGVRQISASYAQLSAKYELAAWIRHLAARAAETAVSETVVLGRAKEAVVSRRFGALAAPRARELLADLIALYRAGQTSPLLFFPALSRAFVQRVRRAPDDPEAERRALSIAARELSDPGDWGAREGADVHVQWVLRGREPIHLSDSATGDASAMSFAEASQRVFGALLDELEESSVSAEEEAR